MTDIVERLKYSLGASYSELRKEAALEIMRLRAKVELAEVGKREISEAHSAVTRRLSVLADENTALRAELLTEKEWVEEYRRQAINFSGEIKSLQAKLAEMEQQSPVATIAGVDEYGPMLTWNKHWLDLGVGADLYALPGAQQCKNCNGMGDRFDPSGEKIPCDLCESRLEEIRALVAEAAHDIISGSDFWLSSSLAAKKIYALPVQKEM